MLEISAFKSFTGHVFDNKEDCIAWEKSAKDMQREVIDNLPQQTKHIYGACMFSNVTSTGVYAYFK